MKRLMVTFVLAVILAPAVVPSSASAETYIGMFTKKCSNGARIANLYRQGVEADALVDKNRFTLSKELSREYYRCSVSSSDPILKDTARFFSASALILTATSPTLSLVEKREICQQVSIAMNELAASSKIVDIKRRALELRNDSRKFADLLSRRIDIPSPEPEST